MSENGYNERDPLVADAMALQRAVISDLSTVPVSADVVAQIVAHYASKSHSSEPPSGMSTASVSRMLPASSQDEAGEGPWHKLAVTPPPRIPGVGADDTSDLPACSAADVGEPPEGPWSPAESSTGGDSRSIILTSHADQPPAYSNEEEEQSRTLHSTASQLAAAAAVPSIERFEHLLRDHARLQGRAETLAEEAAEATRDRAQLQAELAALRSQLHLAQQQQPHASEPAPGGSNRSSAAAAGEPAADSPPPPTDERWQQREEETAASAAQPPRQQGEDAAVAELEVHRLRVELGRALAEVERQRELAASAELEATASAERAAAAHAALTAARAEVQRLGQAAHQLDDLARRAEEEVTAVTSARDWYQQQLRATQEARSALHEELAKARGQLATQAEELERLRAESARARHELSVTQQRALAEKQLLARQLELIEADLLEREAGGGSSSAAPVNHAESVQSGAAASHKVDLAALQQQLLPSHTPEALLELQDEVQRWQHAAAAARTEADVMDAQRMELARTVEQLQQRLVQQERDTELLQERLAETESRLKSALKKQLHQEATVLKARQEKNNAEVALQLALDEKSAFSLALDTLKANTAKVEANFKQLRQELSIKQQQCGALQAEFSALQTKLLTAAEAVQGGNTTESGMVTSSDRDGRPVCRTAVDVQAVTAGAASPPCSDFTGVLLGGPAIDERALPGLESADRNECQHLPQLEQSAKPGDKEELVRLQRSLEATDEKEQRAAHERSLLEQRCASLEAATAEHLQRIEELAAAKHVADSRIQLLTSAKADLEARLVGICNGRDEQTLPAAAVELIACGSIAAGSDSGAAQLPGDKPSHRVCPPEEAADYVKARATRPERPANSTGEVTLPGFTGASLVASHTAKFSSQGSGLAEGVQLLESMDAFTSGLHVKMASLQQQLDAHACAVRSSSESWKTVEDEIRDLQRVIHGDDGAD